MKYIFNADDFGRTETVNKAIVEGFCNGCLDRTTIMVNMPFFEEAIQLSEQYGFKDKVGLHINLTSGEPLTETIKQCPNFCTDQYFNGRIFRSRELQMVLSLEEQRALRLEIDEQIKKFFDMGFHLLHADSHGHVHTFPSVLPIVLSVLKQNGMKTTRLSLNVDIVFIKKIYKSILNSIIRRYSFECLEYRYFGAFREVKKKSSQLNRKSGITEVMLHPNIFDGDMQIGQGMHYNDILVWKKENKNVE